MTVKKLLINIAISNNGSLLLQNNPCKHSKKYPLITQTRPFKPFTLPTPLARQPSFQPRLKLKNLKTPIQQCGYQTNKTIQRPTQISSQEKA